MRFSNHSILFLLTFDAASQPFWIGAVDCRMTDQLGEDALSLGEVSRLALICDGFALFLFKITRTDTKPIFFDLSQTQKLHGKSLPCPLKSFRFYLH